MQYKLNCKGFSILEAMTAVAIFLIFAVGIYSGINMIFKIVYQSRMKILETALLAEELETIRNLPFADVGIENGVPVGVLPHTKTVVRNGVDFDIITTIRNIDDPFDGLAPADTSPADRKLVEMSAICSYCAQRTPVILSTVVAPRNLEGASDNGSLFINVFDEDGDPVQGANVHVENTDADPDIIIDDTTGNDGWLKIIDTATGTLAYNITVSKNNYSTHATIYPSLENPNPSKLPSNITSQNVTEIYFSIDEVSDLNISTFNSTCASLGNANFNLRLDKNIGENPVIYKYDEDLTSSAGGVYNISDAEFGNYYLSSAGVAYDIAGTIPMSPFNLLAGSSQDLYLIMAPKTSDSLLVNVRDAGTELPLSNSTVRLYGLGYDTTIVTDLGYVRQTDWSGGSGQVDFVNDDEYFFDDGNLENNSPAGDLELDKVGPSYLSSGYLESSTFDLGSGVDFQNIIWDPLTQDPETGTDPILFQIASSASSSPETWEFLGPDGTDSSYYSTTETTIYSGHDNAQYLRYRVYLSTADTGYTPRLSEVSFTYTNGCNAPGQAFFSGLSSGTYDLEISHDGYTANSGQVDVDGSTLTIVDMSI